MGAVVLFPLFSVAVSVSVSPGFTVFVENKRDADDEPPDYERQ